MKVFAYGSLMWRPGFVPKTATLAKALGWHREWCIRSIVHRGTPKAPGVVLGLAEGGSCAGILYTVEPSEARQVADYLELREMAEPGYIQKIIEVATADGSTQAITYVSDKQGRLADAPEQAVARILKARGLSGSNIDYADKTFASIEQLGITPDENEIGLPLQLISTIRNSAAVSATRNTNDNLQKGGTMRHRLRSG